MNTTTRKSLVSELRRLVAHHGPTDLPDPVLLERFIATQDDAAFAALVRRHGAMVLGVCRRVLPDVHTAEDAFQATFVLLSKKAGTLAKRGSLGSWLHGVARRTALKARTTAARRQAHERRVGMPRSTDPLSEVSLREALAILDEELARLPEKFRSPLVLCCLEGLARDEAAQHLGWPVKLLKSRVEQARELLRRRLTRRGLTLSAGLFAVLLSTNAVEAAVPSVLLKAIVAAVNGSPLAPPVAALVEGMTRTMLWHQLRASILAFFVAGLPLSALALYWQQAGAQTNRATPSQSLALHRHTGKPPVEGKSSPSGRIYFHQGGGGLHTLEPDGRDEKVVIASNLAAGPHFQPHSAKVSPDGTRLAFGLARIVGNGAHPPSQLRVVEIAKPGQGEVLADLDDAELHRWNWSPDGRKLAFTSWDAKNRTRNWMVDVQTKKLEEVRLPLVKDEKQGDYQMVICAWAPDGQHFLALGKAVHLIKLDGTLVRKLTPEVRVMDGQARFSPDGKKVLYVTFNKDRSSSLFVVDVAGGEPKALVEAANFMDLQAVWSPDGKKIAYMATLMEANGKRGTETSLFVIDADGKNTVTLRTEKHDEHELKMVLTDWR
jgi:RNA polymerase sigma factor (sigma-70 family)